MQTDGQESPGEMEQLNINRSERKFRFAVVGLGHIAQVAVFFANCIQGSSLLPAPGVLLP